jgi:MinD-like ATPase involved in chromosome partitioning or flagellar assembly
MFDKVLRAMHGDLVFATTVPIATDYKEAIAGRLPIAHYKPRGAPARAIKALAEEVATRVRAHEAIIQGIGKGAA